MGRGVLSGKFDAKALDKSDFRFGTDRFSDESLSKEACGRTGVHPSRLLLTTIITTMLSERAKGKQRAVEPILDDEDQASTSSGSHLREGSESAALKPTSRDLVVRFTEGVPDLTVSVNIDMSDRAEFAAFLFHIFCNFFVPVWLGLPTEERRSRQCPCKIAGSLIVRNNISLLQTGHRQLVVLQLCHIHC